MGGDGMKNDKRKTAQASATAKRGKQITLNRVYHGKEECASEEIQAHRGNN